MTMLRRVALAMATLVSVVALPSCEHEPPPASAAEHRVLLERPPVEVALWFVHRYPSYFKSGERRIDEWLAKLDPREREFVLAMGQTLAWAWVEHELARFTATDPVGVAEQASVVVRRKTLNQLELNFEPLAERDHVEMAAFIGDPRFFDAVFARLVRGASNCEGQNHLLAVLIDSALEPDRVWQPRIDVRFIDVPGHNLVRVSGPPLAQPVFVDAWSNLPPFSVDPDRASAVPDVREFGDPPPRLIPDRRGRPPGPPDWYARALGEHVHMAPGRHAPQVPVDLAIAPPDLSAASLARMRDPWRVYMLARVLHIYDDPRATELYQFVLDHHCDGRKRQRAYVCVAAGLLIERAAAGPA